MSARSVVWSFACVAALALSGCGLTLDYGPPSSMDGSVADTGTGCANSCDDGLRCTADSCTNGQCQHASTCTGNTDCVSRGGVGECRRACTSADDCNDDNACTDDLCEPADGHCAHTSNCATGKPTCLDTGACVPTHCANDADCDDQNGCNGTEVCTAGVCAGGTPVTCAASTGCVTNACDPTVGQCVHTLDTDSCADAYTCTRDVCNDDGSCTHLHDDTVCLDADRCTSSTCDPTSSHDATGCAVNATSTCPFACGVMGMCNSATGACDYASACPSGQVCTSDSCQSAGCDTSADCHRTPEGCVTSCIAGTCQTPSCVPPPIGGCARVNPTQCTTGVCQPLIGDSTLCADGDALSMDVCDPVTFMCVHSCPVLAHSCISFAYTSGVCRPVRDSAFCATAHIATSGDCARSMCVGTVSTAPTDDGCAPVAVDTLCADGVGCTADTCVVSAGAGTCSHATDPTMCNDSMDCTTDACDPTARGTTGCTHVPNDTVCQAAAGMLACAQGYCAQTGSLGNMVGSITMPTGCALRYTQSACTGTTICTVDGACDTVACAGVASCDDGNQCNGHEACDPRSGHCLQTTITNTCASTGTDCAEVCLPAGCTPPQIAMCDAMTIMD